MPIKRMWGGRFEESGSDLVNKFGASIEFDQEMAQEDIQGSLAHVKMLKATKILDAVDADAIIKGLETLDEKLKQGQLSFNIENEDIHMNIEALLTEEIGPVAGKLHTGRSRNDQVATDLHLYVKERLPQVIVAIKKLQQVLVDKASANFETIMPGYTHMQHAQPISYGHYLMAYFQMLQRDAERFEFNMLPVNCYLVYDSTKEAAIIDPGCFYAEERDFLRDYIKSKGLTPKHLLCTHLHLDHVFGCKFIKDTYGLGIEANPADEYWLQQAPQQARTFGLTYPEIHEPIEKPLFDGDKVTFGDLELEAICVPGHSPGSLAFYSREKKVLFSGDVLFQGSIGRADLQGGNFEELKEAICNRLFTLPDDVTVYPGHGPSTTIGYEKRNNPFFI